MLNCSKKDCVGCGVCEFTCPKKAIIMQKGNDGFLYPIVDKKLCIDCDLCNKVCPSIIKKVTEFNSNECYAVQLKDKTLLKNCASGGTFAGIASTILMNSGVVFGVEDTLDHLVYSKITNIESLHKVLGSKYYQCNLTSSDYEEIKKTTQECLTLVSGTPCMISAIKNIKGINQDNLITFEILCQGVPNEDVVKKYFAEKEKNKNKKIVRHYFRSKDKYVGRNYLNRYDYSDGEVEYLIGEEDPLSLSFQRQIFLRESCYRCKYANTKRVADFTAGDLWKTSTNIDVKEGCSVLLCNTSKALEILGKSESLYFEKIDKNIALEHNVPFHNPVKRPFSRNYSFKLLNRVSPTMVTKLCCYKYYIKRIIIRRK